MERERVFLQIASDLHLEFLPKDALQEEEEIEEIIHPHADAEGTRILALLGDIGWPGTPVYERLVRHCSARWDHVLLVAGNHEYYNTFKSIAPFLRSASRVLALKKAAGQRPDTMQQREAAIRALCEQLDNVHFLHHDRAFDLVTADGSLYRFLGTILWSDIPERVGFKVRDSINDYRVCVTEDEKMGIFYCFLSKFFDSE